MSELLEVKNLVIEYRTNDGVVQALNNVSFTIGEGKTLGLVGETGAGKTTLAKGIIRLIQSPPGKILQGEVLFNGKDLIKMTDAEIRGIRGFDYLHDISGSNDVIESRYDSRKADSEKLSMPTTI